MVGPYRTSRAHVPQGPHRWNCKHAPVEREGVWTARVVPDGIASEVDCRLVVDIRAIPREVIIVPGDDIKISARRVAVDGRQLPAGRDVAQRIVLKPWHLEHRRQVHDVTPIAQAVAAATITVARVWIRKGRVRACVAGLIA